MSDHHPALVGLVRQLPAEGWTDEQREAFLEAFVLVLDYCIPLIEGPPEPS